MVPKQQVPASVWNWVPVDQRVTNYWAILVHLKFLGQMNDYVSYHGVSVEIQRHPEKS